MSELTQEEIAECAYYISVGKNPDGIYRPSYLPDSMVAEWNWFAAKEWLEKQ